MLGDCFADILHQRFKPVAALGVPVAGHVPYDHKPYLIAAFNKIFALGIARAPHRVEPERFDEVGAGFLSGGRHGESLIGVILHTVDADELDALVVEEKALLIHPYLTEAHGVIQLVAAGKIHLEGIQLRVFRRPRRYLGGYRPRHMIIRLLRPVLTGS